MFLPAICDSEKCLVNTDFIVEIYDLDKSEVRAYAMDSDYPYFISKQYFDAFLTHYLESTILVDDILQVAWETIPEEYYEKFKEKLAEIIR